MGRYDLELWVAEARQRAVRQGKVGDIEWLVSAMGPMPFLNGYLHLTPGHPWLENEEERDDAAPSEVTFGRGRWIGIDGGHGSDMWDLEDLRRNVEPFPGEWERLLEYTRERGLDWPFGRSLWPGYGRQWTVRSWTESVLMWAEAAERAVSPNVDLTVDMVLTEDEREDRRGGND